MGFAVGATFVPVAVSEGVSAASTTFMVTSPSCTGARSITEAVAAANANPGPDVIEFTPGLRVSADTRSCGEDVRWIADVSESVIFEGNGAQLVGGISWVTSGGLVTPLDKCPGRQGSSDLLLATSPGFLSVGWFPTAPAPPGVSVEVRDLTLESLNEIAYFDSDQGSLALEDVTARRILSHQRSCVSPAISFRGQDSDLTLRRNEWDKVINWSDPLNPPLATSQAIQSEAGVGDLVIDDSDFVNVGLGGLVQWNGAVGATLDIVSSRLTDAGGITPSGAVTTNIVNSVFALRTPPADESERIFNASSGEMNIVGSTFMVGSARCDRTCVAYDVDGIVGRWFGGGPVNLRQSAIGVNIPVDGPGSLLANADKSTSGGFSADPDTWVQPVAGQDSAALKTLTGQPGLLTDPPGLATSNFFAALPAYVSPLLGTTSTPGELIDKIPDAACGGTNELLNPIDGSCLTTDVFGNSRWDTGNEARNIGAVQLTLAPHLAVTATGDGTVDVGWNRPVDGSGDTVTGYVVRYRPAGSSGPFTEQSVTGPDTLAAQITGLTNGTEYEFEVAAVRSTAGVGPASNRVTATPYSPVGAPQVTAARDGGEITLFWTEPPSGGHPGPLYYTVVSRPVGEQTWRAGPGFLSARTTVIPGLRTDTPYEFGVHATTFDQVSGPLGTTTVAAVCRGKEATIVGTPGNDVLDGTPGPDVIVARGGNDQVSGGAGDDVICLGPGDDEARGGDGADVVVGGNGADDIAGGAGDDLLLGNKQSDILRGGTGYDTVLGQGGDDVMKGGAGRDNLGGGAGADEIRGGRGRDTIQGGSGPDQLFGHVHADSIAGGDGNDLVRGGRGRDTIFGGDGHDTLYGNQLADTIGGGNGNDRIHGGPGADTCNGGPGRNTITGCSISIRTTTAATFL